MGCKGFREVHRPKTVFYFVQNVFKCLRLSFKFSYDIDRALLNRNFEDRDWVFETNLLGLQAE